MRRFLPVLALSGVLLMAAPAWAHEEINPSTIPTGTPTFLTLNAANEKTVNLTQITLTAPSDLAFGTATKSPPGWTANRTDEVITWSGGAVAPEAFEQWGFEIEGADQPGSLTYKVTLGFADGSHDDVDVAITATAAGSGGAPVTEPATPGTGTPPATEPPTTAAGGPTVSVKSGDGNSGGAYALGAAALALSVVALVRSRRKGSPSPADTPTGGKDW
ncbi:MAG: hypothetical protein QOG43_48 [Actinomycetota bacterium]|jgi:hypothetical protein|nr:hypothetical protein [Actinomycetota bacterium]